MAKRIGVIGIILVLVGLNVYQYLYPRLDPSQLSRSEIQDLMHFNWGGVFKNQWLGISTLQQPLDVWITQEIMFDTKPQVVIETGTYHGGSAVLWAILLENIDPDAQVITVDIEDQREQRAKDSPVTRKRVRFLRGSSTDPQIIDRVTDLVAGRRALVILDSLHTRDHVLKELELYSRFVPVGGYVIVQDTVVNGHPVRPEHGPGPWEAVHDFLATTDDFVIDESRERFGFSNNRNGFLKRVK